MADDSKKIDMCEICSLKKENNNPEFGAINGKVIRCYQAADICPQREQDRRERPVEDL